MHARPVPHRPLLIAHSRSGERGDVLGADLQTVRDAVAATSSATSRRRRAADPRARGRSGGGQQGSTAGKLPRTGAASRSKQVRGRAVASISSQSARGPTAFRRPATSPYPHSDPTVPSTRSTCHDPAVRGRPRVIDKRLSALRLPPVRGGRRAASADPRARGDDGAWLFNQSPSCRSRTGGDRPELVARPLGEGPVGLAVMLGSLENRSILPCSAELVGRLRFTCVDVSCLGLASWGEPKAQRSAGSSTVGH